MTVHLRFISLSARVAVRSFAAQLARWLDRRHPQQQPNAIHFVPSSFPHAIRVADGGETPSSSRPGGGEMGSTVKAGPTGAAAAAAAAQQYRSPILKQPVSAVRASADAAAPSPAGARAQRQPIITGTWISRQQAALADMQNAFAGQTPVKGGQVGAVSEGGGGEASGSTQQVLPVDAFAWLCILCHANVDCHCACANDRIATVCYT